MPRDLYQLMLDALRDARAVPVSPQLGTIVPGPSMVAPVVMAPTWPAVTPLPEIVSAACEQYGFGERDEISANYRRAAELHAAGKSPEVIVREIRMGGDTSGLFV